MQGKLKQIVRIIIFSELNIELMTFYHSKGVLKNVVYLLLLTSVLLNGCKSKCIEDSGKHITKNVSLKEYDEIIVSGPIKLILKQDSTYSLQLSADSNIINQIDAEVSGGKFTVKLDPAKYCGTDSIVLHAGIGNLTVLTASKNTQIIGLGVIHVKDLKINLSDTTSLALNLAAASLKTSLNGSSTLDLAGQTGVHELKSNGSVKVAAFNFIAGMYDLELEGLSRLDINVLNDLKIKSSGSTEINYKGNPKNVNEQKSGNYKLAKVN
jgi:hypothetical protein